jgi:hypothetical protein
MKLIKPNSKDQTIDGISIFLAGSIEMGVAEDWQSKIVNTLKNKYVTILNPRRDDWDSSWVQEQSNPQFNHQVNWELNNLDRADIIFMYFAPDTKSPISLLELGKYVSTNMVVCCPKGFWRKGNVDIVCTRHDAPLFNNFDDAVGALLTKISNY